MHDVITPPWRRGRERLAICPIGWVNGFLGWGSATGAQVMDEIAALGYAASENSAVYPSDPLALRAELAGRGLELSAAYKWVNFAYEERLATELAAAKAHVDLCAEAGAAVVNLAEAGHSVWDARGPQPRVTPFDASQWRRLGATFDEVGEYALERGVSLAVHPHGGTAIETPAETMRLLEATDPALVGLCLDTGHVAYGGGDPGAFAREVASRVVYVHLKDVRLKTFEALAVGGRIGVDFETAARAHLFCPPGQGGLAFDPVFDALRGAGYDGWYVVEAEQDPTLFAPLEAARSARDFLAGRYGLPLSPAGPARPADRHPGG